VYRCSGLWESAGVREMRGWERTPWLTATTGFRQVLGTRETLLLLRLLVFLEGTVSWVSRLAEPCIGPTIDAVVEYLDLCFSLDSTLELPDAVILHQPHDPDPTVGNS